MIAYCDEFVLIQAELMPAAVLSEVYEQPKYDTCKIKGRVIIMADDDAKFPDLFRHAIDAGLISEETYKAEQSRLLRNHGIHI